MPTFRLPDVGEGLTEAEIVTWHVSPGDLVKVNDVLCDIETAKSIVELPSPFAGAVGELFVAEGETVAVGTPIISIGEESAAPQAAGDDPATASAPAAAPARREVLVGYGPRDEPVGRRRRRGVAGGRVGQESRDHEAAADETLSPESSRPAERPARTLAKPPVRKLAKDLGIDLASIVHDGAVVTRDDVLRSAQTSGSGSDPESTSGTDSAARRVLVSGVRKATAEAMVESAFSAPHVSEWVTLDCTRTVDLVEELRHDRAFADVKVTPLLVVGRAVCLALRRTPDLHARWATTHIEFPEHVHLGIAAATDRGLVVPVVRDAETLPLTELGRSIADLVATARAGRLQPAQMTGGTFTITNVGVFGVDGGTPILPPGQSGILALGSIERRPWVVHDTAGHERIEPRWVTTLTVSFDHRVVDGEQGSRFLADVAAIMRDPARALAF